jgi:hypothetical protein
LATVEMFSKFIRKIVFLRMLSTLKIWVGKTKMAEEQVG